MASSLKFILLNGPAGIGKSTIAMRYVNEHPLALVIDGDDIITKMGQWLAHEDVARRLVFELSKSMARIHLKAGHDVILPYLLTHAVHAEEFEKLAEECDARFLEVVLLADKKEATKRLFERGSWGEAGAPPLSEDDRPVVEALYDTMLGELDKRLHTVRIDSVPGAVDETYCRFHEAIS